MSDSTVNEEPASRAIEWFARLRADDESEAERNQFSQWLQESRENQHAFVDTLQLWGDLSVLKDLSFEGLLPPAQSWDRKRKLEASAAG